MIISNEHIIIDLKKTKMTLFELLGKIEQYRSAASWSGYEFYIHGDDLTIRAREVTA